MAEDRRYYVYVVAIDCRVVYVGKGSGKRHLSHLRKSHNFELAQQIEDARYRGVSVRSKIIRANLTEKDAYALERRLIVRHHEKLTNLLAGETAWAERFVQSCVDFLNQLKPEWVIRAEGERDGMTVDERLEWRNRIEDRMERLYRAVMADGLKTGAF